MRNKVRGRIVTLLPEDEAVTVVLDVGCPLQARITWHACQELRLQPGMEVYALIKGVSIDPYSLAAQAE